MTSIHYPSNPKKYAGVVKNNSEKLYYSFSYQNKELQTQIKKKFPYFNQESKKIAYESALEFQFQYSLQNNLIYNIYEPYLENSFKVHLNVPDKYLYIDSRDLPLIENFDWRIQNNSKYATAYMNDIDYEKFNSYLLSIKNSTDNDTMKYVYQNIIDSLQQKDDNNNVVSTKKRHYVPFHLLKYGLEHVDFLNKNPLDNRDENIGILSKSQHSWKSQVGDAKLRINNSSGKTGVFYGKCGNYDYWEVRGKDFFGNKIYRKFSISKHGYEGSKHMAIYFRNMIIDKSYKPHQLDEIYKKIVHDFENYDNKYNLNEQKIELVENNTTINDEDTVMTSLSKYNFDDDEDDDFIIIAHVENKS